MLTWKAIDTAGFHSWLEAGAAAALAATNGPQGRRRSGSSLHSVGRSDGIAAPGVIIYERGGRAERVRTSSRATPSRSDQPMGGRDRRAPALTPAHERSRPALTRKARWPASHRSLQQRSSWEAWWLACSG